MEHLVGLVLQAGELLLISGAEMYRVEETIERMGLAAGFVQVEGFATPTGVFISLHTAEGRVYTRVRRIKQSRNNLAIIAEINSLSRAFSDGSITIDEVKSKLEDLQKTRPESSLKRQFIGGGGAMAFTLIFGGNWFEGFIAGIVGTIVLMLVTWLERYPVPEVLRVALGSIVAASLVTLSAPFLVVNADLTTLGAVMVMTPGVAMTTAIRDLLSGELLSGLSRSAEALGIFVAIATGVAIVLSLGGR